MKITCESCTAQYDLDDNRIPPSGLTMKCPACLHSFTVRKGAASPPPPPPSPSPHDGGGIALSELSDVTGEEPELPGLPVREEPADLPGLREASHDLHDEDVIDLPAPRPVPPVVPPARPPATPPVIALSLHDDLPAPRAAKQAEVIDLPAPKGPPAHVGIGLDEPEADDLLTPVAPVSMAAPPPYQEGDDDGPPPIDLDAMDVVAPKPDGAVDLLTPKPDAMEMAPQTMDVVPRPPVARPRELTEKERLPEAAPLAAPRFEPEVYDEKPKRQLSRGLLIGGGALVLIAALGVSLGLFTSSGYFGVSLITGKRAEVDAQLASARKLLAEDTLVSYRRAGNDLHPLVEADPKRASLAALEAQARYCAARLGIAAERQNADKLLAAFDADEKAGAQPDVQKARALKLLVAGKSADARAKLGELLAAAPSDASALVYLGWTELSAGDWTAAERAFAKAVSAEANRAAGLYGLGFAKEQEGDWSAAKESYEKTLARSPAHFGAQVGLARVAARRAATGDGETPEHRISELIEKRAGVAAPRELAEAWASLGVIAADAGRPQESEDRLKRALVLDPDSPMARVALARVQCDLGRCAEATPSLRKLVMAQPKNLDARLALVRAQLEGKGDNFAADATSTLAPAVTSAPKDARVLYWQGRLLLGGEKVDTDGALAKFKAAVEADAKFIPAYLAESATLSQLGRSDDALDVLKQAAAKAADDAQLLTELGVAYLNLGKPAEAESHLRAALAKRDDLHQARMFLGAALEAQGKLDEAGAAYRQVAEKAPKYPGLLERQGRLAMKQGDKDVAWKLFQSALGDGVPTATLRLSVGTLALELGKLDDAQKMGELVAKEDDRSAAAHLLLAHVALARGRADEALPEARRAATVSDLPEAHLALGRALEGLGKLDQSVAEYQLARRGAVEPEATLGRARIMVRMGATKDALAELNALVRDNKLRAPALVLMGDCYSDLQQTDRARHAYEDAVKYGPKLPEAAFKLGRALHDAGRPKPAIEMLDRALKLAGDTVPFAAEAWLLLGDARRETHDRDSAVKAYKKYLELAPPDSPERAEVQKHISILGGG